MSTSIEDKNLTAIRKLDPFAREVVDKSGHAALFEFSHDNKQWKTTGVDGPLFIYKRVDLPRYSMLIANRQSPKDYIEPINEGLMLKYEPPYIFIHRGDESKINGLWMHGEDECKRVYDTLIKLRDQLQQKTDEKTTVEQMRTDQSEEGSKEQQAPVPQRSQQMISGTEALNRSLRNNPSAQFGANAKKNERGKPSVPMSQLMGEGYVLDRSKLPPEHANLPLAVLGRYYPPQKYTGQRPNGGGPYHQQKASSVPPPQPLAQVKYTIKQQQEKSNCDEGADLAVTSTEKLELSGGFGTRPLRRLFNVHDNGGAQSSSHAPIDANKFIQQVAAQQQHKQPQDPKKQARNLRDQHEHDDLVQKVAKQKEEADKQRKHEEPPQPTKPKVPHSHYSGLGAWLTLVRAKQPQAEADKEDQSPPPPPLPTFVPSHEIVPLPPLSVAAPLAETLKKGPLSAAPVKSEMVTSIEQQESKQNSQKDNNSQGRNVESANEADSTVKADNTTEISFHHSGAMLRPVTYGDLLQMKAELMEGFAREMAKLRMELMEENAKTGSGNSVTGSNVSKQ